MTQTSLDSVMQAGAAHHRAGRLAEAEALYREVLARNPNHSDALHFLGILAGQLGHAETSIELMRRAATVRPDRADVWSDLGNALQVGGRIEEAIAAHRRAVEIDPRFAQAWNNLGITYFRRGQYDQAIEACHEALRFEPNYPAAHANLGKALEAAGRMDEAVAAHQAAVRLEPHEARRHFNLGAAFGAQGMAPEAVAAFREAVRLDPRYAEAYNNLGNALLDQGQTDEALVCYREAVRQKPDYAVAFNNLGHALQSAGRYDEAHAACREALRLSPDDAAIHNNLGNALHAQGQNEEAIACYREALRLNPLYATAFSNLSSALRSAKQLDEGVAACQRALALQPDFPAALNNLGGCLKDQGRLDDALKYFRKSVALHPSPTLHSDLAFCLHFHPDYDAGAILAEFREWDRRYTAPFARFQGKHDNDPTPLRRLRIGYVSPDFRRHVVGFNMLPLLSAHDRERFEIFCYSNVRAPDPITGEIRRLSGHWRDIAGLSDEQAAELIRADHIDVLVDLAMHTAHNRLLVFARKPAPVQANYLAYCSTSGLTAMDYRLSDAFFDPPGTDLSCYSERTIRLERSYWCYQPGGPTPDITPLPALTSDHVVFGCLNYIAKVSDAALDVWAEILRAKSDSRLLIQSPPGTARDRIIERIASRGLATDRIEFVGTVPFTQYLQNWQRIDIGLDPFPHGGGITTCDAIWMGVPVISLSGQTAVGRGGRSILSNLSLPELVADTPQEYVEKAVALAGNLPRLSGLRTTLRSRMESSPLRDASGFARDIESAYRQMWTAWCAAQASTPAY